MRTVLTNATLVDCVQPQAVAGAAVLIEDGRIREIRTDGSTPEPGGGPAIDLRGAYLMPGLWDVHIPPDYYLPHEMPLADQVTLFGHRMMAALTESGITGLRCAGDGQSSGQDQRGNVFGARRPHVTTICPVTWTIESGSASGLISSWFAGGRNARRGGTED